jgi:nitroreductase
MAALYYILANPGFQREQRAVMAGRRLFEESRQEVGSTNSLIRRNIHRLEKGLIMRPRRPVFALEYITETVDKYEALVTADVAQDRIRDDEKRWFRDVLKEYFSIVGRHPVVDSAKERFNNIEAAMISDSSGNRIPFKQARRVETEIRYDQFMELLRQRKSVRWFADRPVPREQILKALDAARYSPSACNRYPFRFHVFDEREKVEIVSKLPGGTVGFAQNFPVIIAIIGELRNYYGERDRHLIYIDASLAAMSVVLAAETLGLATCCINWPDIEEAELQAERVLKLQSDQRPVMFMAMGYPDPEGLVCWSQKKGIEEISHFNTKLGG